jgi:2-haloacid dehalogenase
MAPSSESLSRRTFLRAGVVGVVAAHPLGGGSERTRPTVAGAALTIEEAQIREPANPSIGSVKALVFDVFGTVVDWRTSVAGEIERLAQQKGLTVDGPRFADAWRAEYAPSMNRVRNGELPWTRLDDLHRMGLDKLLKDFRISGLSEAETVALNRAWHRLRPWPDVVSGLTRLKKSFIIAPLSNGNIALMTNMAKHSGLPWDCILGAELVRHYKPDREVYLSAAHFLDLEPAQVMMVAAHLGDLRAAKALGLRTGFVVRPDEYGPTRKPDLTPDASVDVAAKDFNDLARQLGV